MPAHQCRKTKKEQKQATKSKHKLYYQRYLATSNSSSSKQLTSYALHSNKERIGAKRRERYGKEKTLEQKERKAAAEENKRAFWEETAHTEYKRNSLEKLQNLQKKINTYLSNSGTAYLTRSYHEYLAWTQSSVRQSQSLPLKISYKTFNSMLDTVAKIGNAVLNGYGECNRLVKSYIELRTLSLYLPSFYTKVLAYLLVIQT
ncbi:hypothetical protein PQX77_010502 [Marasmius sp. AFHP31]|nr:hypothetical protein PQX77_010502 [Marasmius sp. AFHP31]